MGANKSKLVSIPKSGLESLEATLETLENEYVTGQLERTEQDVIIGKVRSVSDFPQRALIKLLYFFLMKNCS